MNKFEAVLILSPEISSQEISKEHNKFKEYIEKSDGKVVNEEDWGLRDLSYSIKKFKKAFYNLFQIEISGSNLDKIKNDLNQNDRVLRHLFIKVKDHQELPTKLSNEKK
tara:strand:- start:1247 stop:1573 length:327 start_codon:yes stop_codon:yes gene_type:complete